MSITANLLRAQTRQGTGRDGMTGEPQQVDAARDGQRFWDGVCAVCVVAQNEFCGMEQLGDAAWDGQRFWVCVVCVVAQNELYGMEQPGWVPSHYCR